ncbi:hypothetical protein [Pseudorhodoplanes sp.]|uniref:hypothetical protein n=1 Tax=Pseudorhodoplanes sp. TaxID=1934341 RepID=UPI003919E4A9
MSYPASLRSAGEIRTPNCSHQITSLRYLESSTPGWVGVNKVSISHNCSSISCRKGFGGRRRWKDEQEKEKSERDAQAGSKQPADREDQETAQNALHFQRLPRSAPPASPIFSAF